MIKILGWETKLNDYFNVCAERKFEYGVFDCALFMADGVKIMTGIDPAEDFRKRYFGRSGALNALDFMGYIDLKNAAHILAKKYNIISVMPSFAKRGDISLVKNYKGFALGLVDLSGMRIATVTKNGLDFLPMDRGEMFWSIE